MISTKHELKEFLTADRVAMGFEKKSRLIELLKGNLDSVMLLNHMIFLRKYEYFLSKGKRKSFFYKLRYLYYKHTYARKKLKSNLFISPNVFDSSSWVCVD